jgi:hypothetical protein
MDIPNIMLFREILEEANVQENFNIRWVHQPIVRERRADHIVVLDSAEFRRTFRFSKPAVEAIVEMVHDDLIFGGGNKNYPISPLQQVLVALNHYAGGQFQRTTGLCGGISQPTVCRIVKRVTEAICMHKADHVKMPSIDEMHATAGRIRQRFGLAKIVLGVDGMHARLEKAPRGIPNDVIQQDFFNRKGFYSFNVQEYCIT